MAAMIEKVLTRHFPEIWNGDVRKWWRQRKYFVRARARLNSVSGGERRASIAAEAMFYLNHVAKTHVHEEQIYKLKNLLVRAFYEEGYCLAVEETRQDMACWHTRAFLEGEEDVCPKCGNTGIWKRHTLMSFTFNICGQFYNWHQPAGLVDWNPAIGGEKGEFKQREFREIAIHYDWVNLGQAVVWLWLGDWGVKVEELPKRLEFWKAVKADAERLWRLRLRPIWGKIRYRNPEDDPEWIPF